MLTLGISAGLGNSQVRSVAEGISRTISSVPDTSTEGRVGQACPKWLKINAFHVPVFSIPKMCGEVGTVTFFMLYKARHRRSAPRNVITGAMCDKSKVVPMSRDGLA